MGNFDNVFSTLYEENGRNFGVDKINNPIQKYIKSGCHVLPQNSNPNVHESCDMCT